MLSIYSYICLVMCGRVEHEVRTITSQCAYGLLTPNSRLALRATLRLVAAPETVSLFRSKQGHQDRRPLQ